MMRTIKLVLEYVGTGFSGWQVQPGKRTVQGEVEKAVAALTGEELRLEVSGRTDAGVHALGQVASFRTESRFPPEVIQPGLNHWLPRDVAVLSVEEVPPEFHPRKSARGKWYRYLIMDRKLRSALFPDRVWHLRADLELAAMRSAAGPLIGEHDFSSFRSVTCEANDPVREMKRIDIFRNETGLLVVELSATGFLKQMVRIIAGTLAEIGQGKRRPEEMKEILEARDRTRAGVTAPAAGLYLVRVDY